MLRRSKRSLLAVRVASIVPVLGSAMQRPAALEAVVIAEGDRDVLVADPKSFDSVDQVIARFTLVYCCRGRGTNIKNRRDSFRPVVSKNEHPAGLPVSTFDSEWSLLQGSSQQLAVRFKHFFRTPHCCPTKSQSHNKTRRGGRLPACCPCLPFGSSRSGRPDGFLTVVYR